MIDSDNLSLYLMSIYFALTTLATVGYGDITARTNSKQFIRYLLGFMRFIWFYWGNYKFSLENYVSP